jgi:hypothetical protein
MQKHRAKLIFVSSIIILSTACANSVASGSVQNPSSTAQIPQTLTAIQPTQTLTIKAEQPASEGDDLSQALTHDLVPGNPDAFTAPQKDIDTSNTAGLGLAFGDSFRLGIFERPFTPETMVYQPQADLLGTSIASDDNYYYFMLQVGGNTPGADFPGAHYGVEFDTDFDSRGEILLWVQGNGSSFWVIDDVMLLQDTNGDVGGANPVVSDTRCGDGYDHTLFSSTVQNDPDGAWQRLDGTRIQLAVKKDLIGASSFLWKAWADNGLADPALFDYNDSFTEKQAGAYVSGSNNYYTIEGLSQMDSTCWIAYNYKANGYEPGGCTRPQPTAVPQKHPIALIIAPTLTPVPTEAPPVCPPCGTFAMSYDCCVACGSSYVWVGTGCQRLGGK